MGTEVCAAIDITLSARHLVPTHSRAAIVGNGDDSSLLQDGSRLWSRFRGAVDGAVIEEIVLADGCTRAIDGGERTLRSTMLTCWCWSAGQFITQRTLKKLQYLTDCCVSTVG